jgi:hypothetical protein
MADVLLLQVPMKVGLELGAVAGLYDKYPEGKPSNDFVHEANSGLLVADVVDLEHTNARAVVDRCELIKPLSGSGNPLKEFHVDL